MCVSEWLWPYINAVFHGVQRLDPQICGYELHGMGAGNRTRVLWKSNNTETSLQTLVF